MPFLQPVAAAADNAAARKGEAVRLQPYPASEQEERKTVGLQPYPGREGLGDVPPDTGIHRKVPGEQHHATQVEP